MRLQFNRYLASTFLILVPVFHPVQLKGELASQRVLVELTARLRWEILWRDSIVGFPEILPKRAKGAMYLSESALAFCSLDLQRCAYYRVENGSLGQRLKSVTCDRQADFCSTSRSESIAVWEFIKAFERSEVTPRKSSEAIFRGSGSSAFRGEWLPVLDIGVEIGSREMIEREYRTSRSRKLSLLTQWLRQELSSFGYRRIDVPCFVDSDPHVYVVGIRGQSEAIAISVRWDAEDNSWRKTAVLEGPQSATRIAEISRQIGRMRCAVIDFLK